MSRYRISKEELKYEMKRLANKIGLTPTMEDMRKRGNYTFDVYQKRFGSWNNAVEACGLDVNREVNITDSEVINDIQRISEEYCDDDSPTSVDMKEYGRYSENIYLFNETSWDEYLEKSGFESKYRISKQKLIQAINDLALKLDKTPSSRDMKEKGKYTPSPYRRVFGTWNNALEESGFDVIGHVSGKEHPNWKEDSISSKERRKLENWSKRVKNRDNYECQRCQKPRSNVRFAHHIKRRKNHPDIKFDKDNGVTLCADCHAEAHEGDIEYNSLKVLADELAEKNYQGVYHE